MHVGVATVAKRELAQCALAHEAESLVQPDRSLVIGEDLELEAREVEPPIGQIDDGFHQRGAHAFGLPLVVDAHADAAGVTPARTRARRYRYAAHSAAVDHCNEQVEILAGLAETFAPEL